MFTRMVSLPSTGPLHFSALMVIELLTETGHPACRDNDLPQGQKQPESFSHRLRRRFSRESKSSHDHREPGKPGFPFSLKPSKSASRPGTDLAMLEDIGSSLMSERGYDSDAHFITTPSRVAGSAATRGIRRIGLTDLIERSQEREEAERWTTDRQEAAFGMRYIPSPNGSLRAARGYFQATQGANGRRPSIKHASGQKDPNQRISPARSLPNLISTSSESDPSFLEGDDANYVSGRSEDRNATPIWSHFMRKSRQNYGMVSSESLPNLPADIMVPKRRQPTSSGVSHGDPQTVHLSDMGITRQLASHTMSSEAMSVKMSMIELVRRNRLDGFMPLSSDSLQTRHRSGTSALSGPEPQIRVSRQRDASSFYSRQASGPNSANISLRAQSPGAYSPRMNAKRFSDNVPEIAQKIADASSATENGSIQASGHPRSKFREHCDIGDSTTTQSHPGVATELGSPRKVSIGWMTGGRRVGYGYSLVPEPQVGSQSHATDRHEGSNQETGAHMDSFREVQSQREQKNSKETEKVKLQRLSPVPSASPSARRDNGPATLPSVDPSAQTVEGYPVPSFVQAILDRRFNRSSWESDSGALWLDEGIAGDFDPPELPPVLHGGHCKAYAKSSPADDIERPDGKAPSDVDRRDQQSYRMSSRMAQWPQKLSKRRESRRHADLHQQEPSDASSGPYLDCDANSLDRGGSTKSIGAEDLANKYRECMQMPGSFEGGRWAN